MVKSHVAIDDFGRSTLDAIPSPVFVVDDDVRIIHSNQAASRMLAKESEWVIRRRGGEVLHCIYSTENPEGCGRSDFCKDCVIRNAVNESVKGHKVFRQKTKMELASKEKVLQIHLLVTTAPFEYQNKLHVLLILEDITELIELRNLLPICANCKKVREDEGYWVNIDTYFNKYLDVKFTHGICPECAKKLYPDYC